MSRRPTVALLTAALLGPVAALCAAAFAPALAQVQIDVTRPHPARRATPAPPPPFTAPLTLETAVPLAVPARPRLPVMAALPVPPRFVAPIPVEPPPEPVIVALAPIPAPAGPKGAPTPAPPVARPTPATFPPPQAPGPSRASPPSAGAAGASGSPAGAPQAPAAAGPELVGSFLLFQPSARELPAGADAPLAELARRMLTDEGLRVEVKSYASGTAETQREARLLSLARALAVRERLSAAGVRGTRVDIRALGASPGANVGANAGGPPPDAPPDRIDLEFLKSR